MISRIILLLISINLSLAQVYNRVDFYFIDSCNLKFRGKDIQCAYLKIEAFTKQKIIIFPEITKHKVNFFKFHQIIFQFI